MNIKKYDKKISRVIIAALTIMLSGCNTVLMNPKGEIGLEQRSLILTALGLMLIVVIPAIFMAFFFAWKYRSTNINAKYTPNWAHSRKIEVVVWGIPIIIIAILAVITWQSSHALDPFKPINTDKKSMTIEVVSLDWKWLFIYPEQGIATVNELAFPTDVPVEFKVTSNSVMNSFFIPQLGGQIYAMAGMQTKLHLIANQTGQYNGISASYSGDGFSGMKFTALATPTEEAFNQWVESVKRSPNTLNTIADFNQLAQPNQDVPVMYFSSVKPDLFKEIIGKFMKNTKMDQDTNLSKSTDMNQKMNKHVEIHTQVEE